MGGEIPNLIFLRELNDAPFKNTRAPESYIFVMRNNTDLYK